MKNTEKANWLKRAAIVLIAVVTPTLTLAEEAVVASAVNPTPVVMANIADFKLPAKQIDVAEAVPLGRIPTERIDLESEMNPPAPAQTGDADTEEVTVTAENESEEGMPLIAAIPIAIAVNAFLGAVLFAAVPF